MHDIEQRSMSTYSTRGTKERQSYVWSMFHWAQRQKDLISQEESVCQRFMGMSGWTALCACDVAGTIFQIRWAN